MASLIIAAPIVAMAETVRFDIPPQPLAAALKAFASQSHMHLLYEYEAIAHENGNGVVGDLDTHEALEQLLRNTGLSIIYSSQGAATIVSLRKSRPVPPTTSSRMGDAPSAVLADRLAATDTHQAPVQNDVSAPSQGSRANESRTDQMQEVIVTAEKRFERLQDVPIPVSAINAQNLADTNQLRLQDYYSSVPGLSLTGGDGTSTVAIRGITTGGGASSNPTVGVTIDDVPFGSSSGLLAFGGLVPDIDPSDLSRVEVLRGPQGTLYGASSIGGLLKFVTVDPSTESVSGRVQADVNNVYNGAGLGYGFRGALNAPIGDTAAIRISGYTRRDAGYIDNPDFSLRGVNRVEAEGGRFSALWRPLQGVSLKVGALFQDATADGSQTVTGATPEPANRNLQQTFLPGLGGYHQSLRLYTANITAELGPTVLTAVSGYGINKYDVSSDETLVYGPLADGIFGVNGSALDNRFETRKFSQEIRLASELGHKIEWLVGGFYTHELSPIRQTIEAIDTATNSSAGSIFDVRFPSTFAETALFADITTHITDRFDIQFGGRESQNRQVYNETDIGPLVPLVFGVPSPLVNPTLRSKGDAFTYLITPRFKITPDLMIYGRFASGYRPGGPNPESGLSQLPNVYGPDKTFNYELGFKGSAFEQRLSFDASLYYITWKNIQVQISDPDGFTFNTNASSARSSGVELSAQVRPITGLTLGAWVAWNDAKLTSDLPSGAAVGFSGERLPYSSRFSGNLSIDEEFVLTGRLNGFIGGSVNYVGERSGGFPAFAGDVVSVLPSYAKADLRGGLRYESWTANLFINNVTNRRGVIGAGPLGSIFTFNYIQPRMEGLSVSKVF